MQHSRNLFRPGLWWVVLGALAAGCQPNQDSVTPVRKPSARIDPCAERLHDLCGQLLLYHSLHGRFPQSLEELPAGEGKQSTQPAPPVCPVSRLAYVYAPEGLRLPGRSGLLLVYDAQASHSGMRWGIMTAAADAAKGPAVLKVVLLPEELFTPSGK